MERNVNVIVLEGKVSNVPELKYTEEGIAQTHFEITTNVISSSNGNHIEGNDCFEVKATEKLAEICSAYLKKGSKIIISGRLIRQTKDGTNNSSVKIMAYDIKFLPSKMKGK